jgi:DNA-directed RNA polymerase subunit RPC12/RpoP
MRQCLNWRSGYSSMGHARLVRPTLKAHGTTTKMTSADHIDDQAKFEAQLMDTPCVDCARNVNVTQRYFIRMAEKGLPIRCQNCREALHEKVKQTTGQA